MFKKAIITPSLDERFNAATATADAALSVLELAALDLEQSATELEAVEAEAEAQRRAFTDLRDHATLAVADRRAQAEAIRNLVGGVA